MANLTDIGYGVGKYLEASDASDVPDIGTNRKNLDLLNFKVATNNAYALYNFKDGMIDAYQTEAGVDTATSTNESYDSAGKYYSGKIPATGGTITTHGSYTVHSFTNTGNTNFVVGTAGNVSVLVVGGGGGGGKHSGGGGGAGGFRTSASLAVTAQTYTVTVGAGGAGVTSGPAGAPNDGDDSIFSSITSTGGGGGAISGAGGRSGGSGGGDAGWAAAGAGNTPSTSPSQGNPGGGNAAASTGSGGGGASAAGAHGGSSPGGVGGPGGAGGNGTANDYRTGSNVTYAGGGGGGSDTSPSPNPGGAGGSGGGGAGSGAGAAGTSGTANTGGGGGGSGTTSYNGGAGGSGIVVVRYTTGDLESVGNLTLVSNAQTAQTAPTEGRLMVYEETSTGSTTLDTDLKGYVSRDGGTTYTQTPLIEDSVYQEDANVKLLMHMDGANDGTVFTDSSLNQLNVTRAGTPVTKTAEKKFGTASCYLAGSTQWLKLPESTNWSFDAGQDFTIECWCKWSTQASYVGMIASKTSIGSDYNGWSLRTDAASGNAILSFNFYNNTNSATFTCMGTSNIGDGSWHHVAATRASNTVRVFVDGTQENSGTYSGAIHGTSSGGYGLQIGMDYLNATGSGPMHGYVDEVRIVRGVAKYTGSFTEPTTAFDLSPRRLVSGSVDISGQPSGTSMKYKIETLNQSASKVCRLHGASLLWA